MKLYKTLFYLFVIAMIVFIFPYLFLSKEIFLYIAVACTIIAIIVFVISRIKKPMIQGD